MPAWRIEHGRLAVHALAQQQCGVLNTIHDEQEAAMPIPQYCRSTPDAYIYACLCIAAAM
jgi:hypothetical protein